MVSAGGGGVRVAGVVFGVGGKVKSGAGHWRERGGATE